KSTSHLLSLDAEVALQASECVVHRYSIRAGRSPYVLSDGRSDKSAIGVRLRVPDFQTRVDRVCRVGRDPAGRTRFQRFRNFMPRAWTTHAVPRSQASPSRDTERDSTCADLLLNQSIEGVATTRRGNLVAACAGCARNDLPVRRRQARGHLELNVRG